MASLFADLGKCSEDLIKKVFPVEGNNNFETEVNASTSCGTKLQVLVSRNNDDGSLTSTFKPTVPLSLGDTKGELKLELSSRNQTKVEGSVNLKAISGLKVKASATDKTVTAGFEYIVPTFSANVNFERPLAGADSPVVNAATVFVHGNYYLGGRVKYPVNGGNPEVEGRLGTRCTDCSGVLSVLRTSRGPVVGLNYIQRLSVTRTIAAKVQFNPQEKALGERVGITFAVANQVNDGTLVKARFNSTRGTIGVGVTNVLNNNMNLEFGTEFPANLSAPSVYNVKLVYNN
jgi:hypothetical protein